MYAAFSYECMRPSATSVCGLQLLVSAGRSWNELSDDAHVIFVVDGAVQPQHVRVVQQQQHLYERALLELLSLKSLKRAFKEPHEAMRMQQADLRLHSCADVW